MQTIWSPTPVVVLFRRLVDVFSSLSISQHYLLQKTPPPSEANERKGSRNIFRSFPWLEWLRGTESVELSMEGVAQAADAPSPFPPPARPRESASKRSLDIIHRLLYSPLLYDPVRAPRNPVVLCHGA